MDGETTTSKKRSHRRNKKKGRGKKITEHSPLNEDKLEPKQPEKRLHSEDEDSSDEKIVKKKKRNKLVPIEGGKGVAKSIRQQKREKHAAKLQEAEHAAKDALKQQCLEYLSLWKHSKDSWKFMKVKQLWLFKNKFSSTLVPDNTWSIFLEYFASAQGNIKKLLLDDSKQVIEKMDAYLEQEKQETNPDEENTESTPIEKPDEVSYKRARDLIQYLEE